jgi:hypothetical protein
MTHPQAEVQVQELIAQAQRQLQDLITAANAIGTPELSTATVTANFEQRGTEIWQERRERLRGLIDGVLGGLDYRGSPISFRGSARSGMRGNHKDRTRFDVNDFDLDLFTVNANLFFQAQRNRARVDGGMIWPNDPKAPQGLAEKSREVVRALRAVPDLNAIGRDVFAFEGRLLGMTIRLSEWRGLQRVRTFQLHGVVEVPEDRDTSVEIDETSIDLAVMDLLDRGGAGRWRVPSTEEIMAEVDYRAELDREADEDLSDRDKHE